MKGFLYGQTEYNLRASATRLDEYIEKAKSCGFDYLTITDSNLYGCYKFYVGCEKNGIKPVLGLEYTIQDEDMSSSRVLFYARNNEGYRSLLKITFGVKTSKWNTMDVILPHLSNLIYIYVYENSFIERLFRKGETQILNEYLDKIKENKGYIGFSMTNSLERTNEFRSLMDYLRKYGVPFVPLHQMKYLKSEDSIIYDSLRLMAGKPEERGEFDDYSFLENPREDALVDALIGNIHYDLFHNRIALPKYPNTKGKPSDEYLWALCHKGLERRGKYTQEYLNRLSYELSVIHKMGYDDYFLIVWDFVKYSKQNDILVGPGRGSAAGSLVAYCLGITDVDPLKYDLLFERFLNPERVSMPDIDTDFPDDKRDLVIQHVRDVYGSMHVCSIGAFGTFQVKSSVKELAKVFRIEENRIDKILGMIEEKGYDVLLKQYEGDELYQFLYVARGLEGLPHHITTHAAGIILSQDSLDDIIPLAEGITDIYQSQWEATDLEKIGLLKMDFLGISNLSMIYGMLKDIPGFTMESLRNIPLDDPKVYSLLQNGDTLGIFQMERVGFRKALRDLKPTEFSDIVAILALYRPGPMENIPEYVACKHGKKVTYLHPDLEPILRDTYGVIVYQEQIMKIAQKFAGYSLGEADLLRRAVSKKDANKLQVMQSDFVAKSIRNGYSKDIAESIYSLIFKFADYGFNKSHSVAYAIFAYQMLYFKANYFNVFMSNIMNKEISNTAKLVEYIKYGKARGLYTQKPNINVSTNRFVFVKNWLYLPLNAIFSVGDSVARQIIEEREKGQFRNYDDFLQRCSFLNASTITALVHAGALDVFGKTRKEMLDYSDKQKSIFRKHIGDKAVHQELEFDFSILREMEKKYIGINLEYNLFKNAEPLYLQYNAVSLSKIRTNEWTNVLVSFSEIKEIKTKKGDLMLLGTIEDEAKSYHFTIFPRVYAQIPKGIITLEGLYLVNGVLDKDNRGELTFTIQQLNKLGI